MSRRMVPVEIIGLKVDLPRFIPLLASLGCMDIEQIGDTPEVMARPLTLTVPALKRQEELHQLLSSLNALLSLFQGTRIELAQPGELTGAPLDQAQGALAALLPQVEALTSLRDELLAEQSTLPMYEATLIKLLPLIPLAAFQADNLVIGLMVNRANIAVLDQIARQVMEITQGMAHVAGCDIDESTRAMLIVAPNAYGGKVETLVGEKDITRLRLPPRLGSGHPAQLLANLHQRQRQIPPDLQRIDDELRVLAGDWTGKLLHWRYLAQAELDDFQVLNRFGETDSTFVQVGWVPAADLERVKTSLHEAFGERLYLQELPLTAARETQAPVLLSNPRLVQPYENLVKMMAIPRYNRSDPSFLTAIFLPVFFGMMLGDIGYGLITLAACLALMRRWRAGFKRDLLNILAVGSAWAVVFGVLFGELFGTLGEMVGLHPVWMARDKAADVIGLLLMTVAIGAGHVTLGLVLGVWQAIKDRSRSHLLERGGMLIGLCGLFLLVAVLVEFLPAGLMTPAVAIMALGIILLSASLGWIGLVLGPIEFIGLIGNVLSYLRIAAIGLASVYLAKVANEIAGMTGSIIVGLILAVLLHAFNLVLGIFSPSIQSLRLHYVEFYRKFYEGGGRPYEPFKHRPHT